jgi:hypothetical protein
MSNIPSIGLYRTDKHVYHWNGGPGLPGVTGISDSADDKSGLINWAKRETARCAVDNYDLVRDLIERGGRDNAIQWLSGIPDFIRDTAGDLGTRVHRLSEQIARGAEPTMTEEERKFTQGYRNFLEDYRPEFESLEGMIVNLTVGYGGTYDGIARINGKRTLFDIKTSRTVQAKTAVQLAAYAQGEFVGRINDPRKYGASKLGLDTFEDFAVLHVRPEQYARGYRLIRFRVGPAEWDAFLHAKALSEWRKQSKDVIGESVPAPAGLEAAA